MFGIGFKARDSFNESIKYISNSIIKISQDGNGNVIGLSSSRPEKQYKLLFCKEIEEKIKEKNLKVKFLDFENKNDKIDCVKSFINKEKENNDIVFVNIPSVSFFADSVEYAKLCDRVILLEKYMYSTYKDYEESIIRLKSFGVRLEGVIAYGK